jgi:hypothetical protein
MPAGQAQAQVHPRGTQAQALLAAEPGAGLYVRSDEGQVRIVRQHGHGGLLGVGIRYEAAACGREPRANAPVI